MTDTTTYSFITNAFRYSQQADQVVRANYALARSIELDGRLTNLADADTVSATIFGILKAPRLRFEVPVLGVDVMTLTMLDGQTPCAMLTSDRFNLQQGLLVLIPDFTVNLGSGQTTLRCWG